MRCEANEGGNVAFKEAHDTGCLVEVSDAVAHTTVLILSRVHQSCLQYVQLGKGRIVKKAYLIYLSNNILVG